MADQAGAEHYRLEDFTEDTVEFVRQLNAPAVLVGHSIGGVIALMAAARCPEKVKALIIEDPTLTLENYKRIIDSSRDMFNLWLDLKKSARSEKNYPWLGQIDIRIIRRDQHMDLVLCQMPVAA